MSAYYNEFDPFAAAWLRELMADDLIAPGIVDERSIEDVTPSELAGFTQCHFFAGIGVWSLALRLAGWPDDRPIWTGSCPCQPFSAAGKGGGFADERHLWPALHWLIGECRPAIVIGEQVSSDDGLAWLNVVFADLDQKGYTSGALDTCAAGFGAPHIRQRLYWMGYAERAGQQGRDGPGNVELHGGSGAVRPTAATGSHGRLAEPHGRKQRWIADGEGCDFGWATWRWKQSDRQPAASGVVRRLADAYGGNACAEGLQRGGEQRLEPADGCALERVADTDATGSSRKRGDVRQDGDAQSRRDADRRGEVERPGPTNGLWRAADWLGCRDGKWRPVEPSHVIVADAGAVCGTMGESGRADHPAEAEKIDGATSVEREEQPPGGGQGSEVGLRNVRDCAAQAARPPQGSQPAEQRTDEPPDAVRLLPQALSLAQFRRDHRTEEALQALREACRAAGAVCDPLESPQEAWRSLGEEGQKRLSSWLGNGPRFVTVRPFPLAPTGTIRNRVGALRGAGNALNVAQAQGFIAAMMGELDNG